LPRHRRTVPDGAWRVWKIPTDGARPTALTPVRDPDAGTDRGDYDLYQLTTGMYTDALGRRCGNHLIAWQAPGGQLKTCARLSGHIAGMKRPRSSLPRADDRGHRDHGASSPSGLGAEYVICAANWPSGICCRCAFVHFGKFECAVRV